MKGSYAAALPVLLGLITAVALAAADDPKPHGHREPAQGEPDAKASTERAPAPKGRDKSIELGPATRPDGAGVHSVGSRLLLSEIQLAFDDQALAKRRIKSDAAAEAVLELLDRLLEKDGMFLLEEFEAAQVTIGGKTFAIRELGKVQVSFFLEQPLPNAEQMEQLKLWTCPAHPEVVMEKPGKCPICHGELERLTLKHVEQLRRPNRAAPQQDRPNRHPQSEPREPQP